MADPRRHDLPDAQLAARLETALHDELGRGHVDVAELIRGTRRGSRRARARRTALIAATAVAVAAVPIAIATMESRPSGHAVTPAASGGTSAPDITPMPATAPPATGSPEP